MASKKAILQKTLILLPVYVNVVMMGAAVGWIANALFLLKQPSTGIPITFIQGSWIAASTQIGKLACAIPAGILCDKIGRKTICTSIAVVNLVCWLTLSMSKSVEIIFLLRFGLGIAMALLQSVALILIGEIASPKHRGVYVGMHQACTYIGHLFEAIIAVIFSSYRILAYATTILSLTYFVVFWWLEESPNYLINKSKHFEALEVLRRIRPNYTEEQLLHEFDTLKESIRAEHEFKKTSNFLRFLYSPMNRNCLLLLIGLNFFSSFIGSAPITSYITLILPKNRYVHRKFYPLIAVVLKLLSATGASFLLDKWLRKSLYVSVTTVVFLLHILNGVSSFMDGQWWDVVFIVGNYVFLLLWASFLEPVNDLVKSEILPQNIKGFGSSLCVMSVAASKALSYTMFGFISTNFGVHWNYWIFAANCLITSAIVYFALPEGRGKSLADIQNSMRKSIHSVDDR